MIALVTGASSGLGRDMAIYLAQKGYDIIAVGRNEQNLAKLEENIPTNLQICVMDIAKKENCFALYERFCNEKIDILINNAGFGDIGFFSETNIEKDISMIETNVTALHILTKLFLKDMVKRGEGRILNVASIAAFMPGPLMATYYATKAYVLRLTQAVSKELQKVGSGVKVCALCPGPVATGFDKVANVDFHLKAKDSQEVARYAVDKLLKGRRIIVPGIDIKLARLGAKLVPDGLSSSIAYKMQSKKISPEKKR